jgi:hypothetical protein
VAVIVLASFLWAKYGATKQKTYFQGLLISLPIVAFLQWGEMDMLITYELNIAAYYLLLGTALATRQFYLVVVGIILCLLSRYTLLFWIPIAAITLWFEQPLKKNILLWGAVLGAFLVFYIIPFISREPSILANGVLYHNGAAMGDWIGTGFPDYISWTQETGISFSIFMKEYFSGTWEQRIYTSRVVQASFMLLIFFSSIYLYFKKWKGKIHYYDFLLAFLYIEMLFFYNFGPLTYRYYLVSMMMLSSVLVFRIRTILANSK